MSLRTGAIAVLAAAVVLLALTARQPGVARPVDAAARDVRETPSVPDPGSTPVLVELFTSEGCSSCPPADALLSHLGRKQPVPGAGIIALEEHVDYWDRLGWKDPFSSEAATARQSEYGDSLGGREVYTPQMIVDGRAELVGNSETDALRAIRAASQTSKPAVRLTWENGNKLAVHIDPLTNATRGGEAEAYLVVAENRLHSDVKRGENEGRALEHDGVARQFRPLGKIETTSLGFSSTVSVQPAREWNRSNLRAVVFVQERRGRRVLAAAAIPFPAD